MKAALFALITLALGMPAFGALQPAKDVVAETKEAEPTVFEISRPHLNRFYSTVLAEGRSVKDEVKTLQAAPVKSAAKKDAKTSN